jgi:hypothetical protein
MLEIISNENPIKLEDAQLRKVTTEIRQCGSSIRRSFYKMASLLYKVQNERLFVNDGFMSATDYAEKVFGFKKSLCYNLISVGEVYTAEGGKESNLPHDTGKDYTSSQLKVILPYEETEVRRLAEEETITPYMTVNALKKTLKTELGESDTDDGEEVESEAEEVDESPEPEYLFEIKAYYDHDGNVAIQTAGEVPTELADIINTVWGHN